MVACRPNLLFLSQFFVDMQLVIIPSSLDYLNDSLLNPVKNYQYIIYYL